MSNVEWDGKGLPPVGFVGIADFDEDNCDSDKFIGKKVTVVGNFELGEGNSGIVIYNLLQGICAIMYYKDGMIKPIKSERDKAIEEMRLLWNKRENCKSFMEQLYDAGYRKVEQ